LVCGHPGDLGLRRGVDAEGLDQLVHPPGGDPGRVAVGCGGDQGGLGALAALGQPLEEVGALAQLGDRDIDGANLGVQVGVPVTVALSGPARWADFRRLGVASLILWGAGLLDGNTLGLSMVVCTDRDVRKS